MIIERLFCREVDCHDACGQRLVLFGPVVETRQAISPSQSSDCASFLEEVMMSPLNEFSARRLQPRKAICCGEKNGGVMRYIHRSLCRVEERQKKKKTLVKLHTTGSETPGRRHRTLPPLRGPFPPRFCYSLVFGSGGAKKAFHHREEMTASMW